MPRERVVTVRLTEEEYSRWSALAASNGRTLANWIRWRCDPGDLVIPPLTAGEQPELEKRAGGVEAVAPQAEDKTSAEGLSADVPAPAVSGVGEAIAETAKRMRKPTTPTNPGIHERVEGKPFRTDFKDAMKSSLRKR